MHRLQCWVVFDHDWRHKQCCLCQLQCRIVCDWLSRHMHKLQCRHIWAIDRCTLEWILLCLLCRHVFIGRHDDMHKLQCWHILSHECIHVRYLCCGDVVVGCVQHMHKLRSRNGQQHSRSH